MASNIAIWFMRVLEASFFIGIIGCALTVLFSWISIFGAEFKHDSQE
jgi:hypothetical protein